MEKRRARDFLVQPIAYQRLFDELPLMIYCQDVSGRIVYVNPALAQHLDLPPGDLEGLRPDTLFSAHTASAATSLTLNRTGEAQCWLSAYETPAGRQWAHLCQFPLRDSAGSVVGSLGVALEATAIIRRLEALSASEAKFRAYFEFSSDAMFRTSREGRIVEVNEAALQMFGITDRAELLEIRASEFYKNKADWWTLARILVRDGMVDQYPLAMKRKDGQILHGLVSVFPLRDETGRICAFQGSVHDVTALKRAEARHHQLERLLMQSQKMRAVGSLAGGIAHDFNNLLFAIMGNIEIAQKLSGADQAARLERSLNTCMDAKNLIQRFLAMAETDRLTMQKGSIADLIQGAVSARLQKAEQIQYHIQFSGGLYPAVFARDQMLQLLENLFSNAEQAMPEGGAVFVSAENLDLEDGLLTGEQPLPPGRYVKVRISDTGVGIAPDIMDRIFDPYFTTRPQPSSRGHGLGLTTVYSIIKRHQGDISIESRPDEGSTVTFYLPAAQY